MQAPLSDLAPEQASIAPAPPLPALTLPSSAAALALTASLAACGGGGGEPSVPVSPAPPPAPTPPPAGPTREQASRLLTQATLGADTSEIESVRALGTSAWIDAQLALPRSTGYVAWLLSKGYDDAANQNNQAGANNMLWRKLIGSPDPLRQRVTLALSEIFVISINGLALTYRAFASAAYLDILEANAFGNVRDLLSGISTSAAMGSYLTFRGNTKADASRGSLPDENYARELMQLFTVGLHELNADGSLKLVSGQPVETYGQADVSGLARVFTGWDLDTSGGATTTIQPVIRPMIQVASRHELGDKRFLGTVIPANTAGAASLALALWAPVRTC